jgi:hypothetical protein
MVKAYERPEKEGLILVTFFHGLNLAQQERYTDWDQPYLGFTSEPRMALDIPENDGTFDKRELRIVLPNDIFVTRAAGSVPHSPMFVQIEELTQGLFTGDQATQKTLYNGRIVRTIANYQGQSGKAAFFALPQKSRLEVSMGVPCTHHCANTLAHGGCGVNIFSFSEAGGIDSQDGTENTVTTASILAKGAADARYWKRGYLEKDGLRIAIRDYDGDTDTGKFYTARPVPTDWIGGSADVTFVAGCDKTIETCRSRFSAEEFFLGLGYAIPSYHPQFEDPGS